MTDAHLFPSPCSEDRFLLSTAAPTTEYRRIDFLIALVSAGEKRLRRLLRESGRASTDKGHTSAACTHQPAYIETLNKERAALAVSWNQLTESVNACLAHDALDTKYSPEIRMLREAVEALLAEAMEIIQSENEVKHHEEES